MFHSIRQTTADQLTSRVHLLRQTKRKPIFRQPLPCLYLPGIVMYSVGGLRNRSTFQGNNYIYLTMLSVCTMKRWASFSESFGEIMRRRVAPRSNLLFNLAPNHALILSTPENSHSSFAKPSEFCLYRLNY